MPSLDTIVVAHVKQSTFLPPSETFVINRVLNPVCQRPVPVLTEILTPNLQGHPELAVYQINELGPLTRRLEMGTQLLTQWSPYYWACLRRLRPQVIHAHFSFSTTPVLWSARQLGLPLLAGFYGLETKRQIHDPVWLPRLRRIFARADAITCVSQTMVDDLVASGCPPAKISLIRVGVGTEFFCDVAGPWQPGDKLRLLSIARLHPEKGLTYLIHAGSLLNASGFLNWELKIIGTGQIETQLRQQVRDQSLEAQVQFVGACTPSEARDQLQQTHLMILPSLQETQGVALQEAQATGTPVIATRVGGIPEGVRDGETGLLVPPRDAPALAQAILAFVHDPMLISKMGLAARQYVRTQFSRDAEYRQLADLYAKIIQDSKLLEQ